MLDTPEVLSSNPVLGIQVSVFLINSRGQQIIRIHTGRGWDNEFVWCKLSAAFFDFLLWQLFKETFDNVSVNILSIFTVKLACQKVRF